MVTVTEQKQKQEAFFVITTLHEGGTDVASNISGKDIPKVFKKLGEDLQAKKIRSIIVGEE